MNLLPGFLCFLKNTVSYENYVLLKSKTLGKMLQVESHHNHIEVQEEIPCVIHT